MSTPRIICLSAALLFVACSGKLEDPIEAFQSPGVKSGNPTGGDGGTGGTDIPPGDGGSTVIGDTGGGAAGGGGAGPIGDVTAGEMIYVSSSCAACHGDMGEGKDGLGSSLVMTLPNLTREQVVDVIANGRPLTAMAAFSPSLDDQQIQDVTEYIIVTFGM